MPKSDTKKNNVIKSVDKKKPVVDTSCGCGVKPIKKGNKK